MPIQPHQYEKVLLEISLLKVFGTTEYSLAM